MSRRKKLAFSLGVLLVLLAIVEGVCRVAVDRRILGVVEMPREGGWVKADDRVGFVLVPGDYDGTHVNRIGLRGPEVETEKKPGCRRILMLGGSTTYGNTVKTEDAYPAVVQRSLTAGQPGACVEVINAGISGAHSGHQLARYRHIYSALKPDVVTLYVAWNDIGLWLWTMDDWKPDSLAAESLVIDMGDTQMALLRASKALHVGYTVTKGAQFRWNLSRVARSADPAAALAKPMSAMKQHLAELIDLARADGARVVLIKFPFVLDDTRAPQDARELERMPGAERFRSMLPLVSFSPSVPVIVAGIYDELARQPGVTTVDCAAAFRKLPLERRMSMFDDVIHPNAEGYRELGTCVAGALRTGDAPAP
ncbi:MAG TPA: SGNH/GDSL hydrolase family protein [Polyangiaceae bacterium]|nr:SGNH/GDSL hydrolase family protein [Polyangiaceae bacterium]